jgi:hypothetical protein
MRPKEVEMRRAVVALCSAALLVTLAAQGVAAGSGHANQIRGELAITTDFGPPAPSCPVTSMQAVPDQTGCWYGTVTGDMSGTIAFWEDPPEKWWQAPGDSGMHTWAGHFFEKFTFWPSSGGWIVGYDNGLFNLKTGHFVASGFVTDASLEWQALVGYRYFEQGTTTDPMVYPISAPDVRFFMTEASREPLR